MNRLETLSYLTTNHNWPELLKTASAAVEQDPNYVQGLMFAGLARLRLGLASAACADLRRGLEIAPNNRWGVLLLSEALMAMGDSEAGIAELRAHLDRQPDDDQAKMTLINALARAGQFEEAQLWNGRRKVVATPLPRTRNVVVVQTFVKSDTLDMLFDSLCNCSGTRAFDLFIIQDSIVGSQRFSGFVKQHGETAAVIGKWLPALMERFSRVTCHANEYNVGTTATCQRALDAVCQDYHGFMFFEDDCILAPNALDWMAIAMEEKISANGPFFVGGESGYFQAERQSPDEKSMEDLRTMSKDAALRNAYVAVDFVPSTCFATTAAIWRPVGGVRGLPLGDTNLTAYLKSRGSWPICILPVVPRVKDVGMRHEFGYSMAYHGRDGIKEDKTTALLSDAAIVREEIIEVQTTSPILSRLAL
jgi:hypothetical protein